MTRIASALGLLVSLVFLAPSPFQGSVVATTPHDYFNALVKRPDHWKSFSLRDQTQLMQYRNATSKTPWINYTWPSDTDPNAQDAAKVVVPAFEDFARSSLAAAVTVADTVFPVKTWTTEFYVGRAVLLDSEAVSITAINQSAMTITVRRGFAGTAAAPHAGGVALRLNINSLPNQVRLPIGMTDGSVYFMTWDVYWTDSFLRAGPYEHKAFQFSCWSTDSLCLEVQARYSGAYADSFNAQTDVASLTLRSYNKLGGNTSYARNTEPSVGPGVTKLDPIQPMANQFVVKPNQWVRFWVRLDMRATDYDYVDVWAADETRNAVQLYKQIPMTTSTFNKFWLEFNASYDRFSRGDTRDLVAYVRNVAILRNVPPADVPKLLQSPEGVPRPAPPRNVRLVP